MNVKEKMNSPYSALVATGKNENKAIYKVGYYFKLLCYGE